MLKIGDKVKWSGAWGTQEPKEVKITGIELTKGGKYGTPLDEVAWSEVYDRFG